MTSLSKGKTAKLVVSSQAYAKITPLCYQLRGKKLGIFIDNANWFYPQQELGWRISFAKLYKFLENAATVKTARLYAGTPLDDTDRQKFEKFCQAIKRAGFDVATKPLKKILVASKKGKAYEYKCNFDVEIALDVARNIDGLDVIIIGSGDSDFLEIKRFALEYGKTFLIVCFERGVAWEMRKGYHLFLEDVRDLIAQDR